MQRGKGFGAEDAVQGFFGAKSGVRHLVHRLLFVLRLWYHSQCLKALTFAGAKAVPECWNFTNGKKNG